MSATGTPQVALLITSGATALLMVTGTFELVISIAAVLFVLNYLSAYLAVFKLRVSEPSLPRPYRAWGYPWTTSIVTVGSRAVLLTVIWADPRAAALAGALLLIAAPLYWWMRRRNELRS